jgi:2'-5' RNA ligase
MNGPVRDSDSPVARLFFAALPDQPTRDRIAGAIEALHLNVPARLVPLENYHVTLAFIGEIPLARVSQVLDIGRAVNAASFALQFDAYDYWPNPQVVVAAARSVPPALQELWGALYRALAAHELALEPKHLRPHVTLARKVLQPPVLQAMSVVDWVVNEFSLVRSEPRGGRSSYTVVDTWSLLDDSAKT